MSTPPLAHRPRQGLRLPRGERNGQQLIESIRTLIQEYDRASSNLVSFNLNHKHCYTILLEMERIDVKQISLNEEYSSILQMKGYPSRTPQKSDDIEHREAFLVQELGQLAFRRKQLNTRFNEISSEYGTARHPDDEPPLNRDLDILTENVGKLDAILEKYRRSLKRLRELKAERSNTVVSFSNEDLAEAGAILEERCQIDQDMASQVDKTIRFTKDSPMIVALSERTHESFNARKRRQVSRERHVEVLRNRRTHLSEIVSVDHVLAKSYSSEVCSRSGTYRKVGIYAGLGF